MLVQLLNVSVHGDSLKGNVRTVQVQKLRKGKQKKKATYYRFRYRTISFINRALVWFAMISHVSKSFSFLISFGPTIKQHPSAKTKACKLREDLTEVCGLSDFHMAKCQKNRFRYKVLICRIRPISKNIIKTR